MAVLTFPKESIWQTDGDWPISYSSTVFVRQCYPELFSWCERLWRAGTEGLILKGVPGVGKSYFLDYSLDRLMKEGKKVLVLSGPRNRAWLCSGYDNELEEGLLETAVTDEWAKKVDYVLFDPHEDPNQTLNLHKAIFCKKPFLIAMSPDPLNCKKILKDTRSKESLYMGPTLFPEAENMRASCYSNIADAVLRTRFAAIGGIPRFLFDDLGHHPDVTDVALAAHLERQTFALNDAAENPRRIDPGNVASQFNSLWSLYHLTPCNNYSSYTIELCCDSAAPLLRRRLMEKSVRELWNLFYATNDKQGTLRGIRFEAYAHKKILVDGIKNLTAKRLTAQGISSSTSSHLNLTIPSGLIELELADNDVTQLKSQVAQVVGAADSRGRYFLPRLPNYPVLDSAVVNHDGSAKMFQMKAGKSKPLSANHVTTVHEALGSVFVVVTPAEHIVDKKLVGGPETMLQYVLVLNEQLP